MVFMMAKGNDLKINKEEILKMAEVKIEKVVVKISEVTVRALEKEIKLAKLKKEKIIRVETEYSSVVFEVRIELESNTMESLGYHRKEEKKVEIKDISVEGVKELKALMMKSASEIKELKVSDEDTIRLRKEFKRKLFFNRFVLWYKYQGNSWKSLFKKRRKK